MRTIIFALVCFAYAVSGRRVRLATPHVKGTLSDELRHSQKVGDVAPGYAVASESHQTFQSLAALKQAQSKARFRMSKPCKAFAKILLAFNDLTHSSHFLRRGLDKQHVSGRNLVARSSHISLQLKNASHDGIESEDPLQDSLLSGEESERPSIAASTIKQDMYRNVTAELITDSIADAANKSVAKEDTEKALAALEKLFSARSSEGDNPIAAVLKNKEQNKAGNDAFTDMLQERRDTDAWITDRLPFLLKIRRFVLPMYFFYCWRRGWIGTCGLLQGGLFADSYFEMLVVPARIYAESPLHLKAYWMVKFYVDNAIRLMYFAFDVLRRKTTLAKGLKPYKMMWEQFSQALKPQQEQQQGSAQTAKETSVVDVEQKSNNRSQFLGGLFSQNPDVNASDKFITDRFPVLQKPKRLILMFFFGYAFQKGWIAEYGLFLGILLSYSYFDMLAVPLRAVPASPFYEQPFLVTQALVNVGCGTLGLLFRFMRGENPLADWFASVKETQAAMTGSDNSTEEVAPTNQTASEFSFADFMAQWKANNEEQLQNQSASPFASPFGALFGSQQKNDTDAFITNRLPALQKSKRAIFILFYSLCFWQGWIGRWGLLFGAVATRSYFDMIAVPLRLHFDKPFYLMQLYVDYAFRAIFFVGKLLRGEKIEFLEQFNQAFEPKKAEEAKAPQEKEPKQSADGATVIDVEATTVGKNERK